MELEKCKIININNLIYVLSNEEINKGDWYIHKQSGNYKVLQNNSSTLPMDAKKIIATTDSFLKTSEIKIQCINCHQNIQNAENNIIGFNGHCSCVYETLPQPSQSFTKKYVTEYNKDNIITEVLVEYENVNTTKKEDYQYIQGKGSNLNYIYKPKLTKENTITIHPVNKMYSKEEVEVILENYRQYYRRATLKEELQNWIKENL